MFARRLLRDSDSRWTPDNITTALWLDAADTSTITLVSGAVSQWSDKSGNNRHATQTTAAKRPAYITAQYLSFNGGDDILSCPLNINGWTGISVFWVVKPNATTSPTILNFGYTDMLGLLLTTGTALVSFDGRPNRSETYSSARIAGTNTARIIAFGSYDLSNLRASYNGGNEVSAAVTTSSIFASSLSEVGGLTLYPPFNNSFESEIIVLNRVVSLIEKQKVEGYLAHKWGLTANIPVNHPYKVNPPTV